MARPIPRDPPVTNATLPDNEDIDPNPQVIECHYNTPRIMTTACIIGAGELGGAVAHALARGERVGRVVLIDAAGGVAAGKALDIQQSGAVEGFHTQLAGTDDLTRVTGCDVCVVADRTGSAGEWRGEEAQAMMTRLAPYLAATPTVFAGPSQGDDAHGPALLVAQCAEPWRLRCRRLRAGLRGGDSRRARRCCGHQRSSRNPVLCDGDDLRIVEEEYRFTHVQLSSPPMTAGISNRALRDPDHGEHDDAHHRDDPHHVEPAPAAGVQQRHGAGHRRELRPFDPQVEAQHGG